MKRQSRAWILLPASIVAAVAIGLVVSNFQKEVGLVEPDKSQTAAVAAMVEALDAAAKPGGGFSAFSEALLTATVAQKNSAVTNPADTRVQESLTSALDCLTVVRQVWQAELEGSWDAEVQGSSDYWNTVHPALELPDDAAQVPEDVRVHAVQRATQFVEQAIDLVD